MKERKGTNVANTKVSECYTTYDVYCHMAFYVTAVTFLVTLSMNKFTNVAIQAYF
jgi:hypothetical protein